MKLVPNCGIIVNIMRTLAVVCSNIVRRNYAKEVTKSGRAKAIKNNLTNPSYYYEKYYTSISRTHL